jgi:NADH-quinone oxidoreductase subunit L
MFDVPLETLKFIPWLSAAAAVLCGLCCLRKNWRVWSAPICILAIAAGFIIAFAVNYSGKVQPFELGTSASPETRAAASSLPSPGAPELGADAAKALTQRHVISLGNWIYAGASDAPEGALRVGFSYFIDPLTIIMLFVVTGIGALVAIYAAGYMKGDRGYARFFAGVSLFIFAMTTLVMADNLVLLYLGWEGVGLCSYLLIGFYYQKPSAVAAAKKAFIVNRIGDLGFALGIFLTYKIFGTLRFAELFPRIHNLHDPDFAVQLIPFLLMLGAFGKSAQLPLYVWLPDAMEGPTPVSALIHAATMVTAGVYMIARLLPLFMLSPYALPTVAVVGGLTALFAATIALCQFDIKRIYAYSTISQLGYMFLGVGALTTTGGIFHLFTHAFFKALLFLTAGSVMHALAGQLDLRKMSGLAGKMPVTAVLMLIGCLALAGFPLTAGFFSKDMILGAVMERGLGEHDWLYTALAILGLGTAFLTAFYTFRLWFRVFLGPVAYELGEEHHGADEPAAPAGSAGVHTRSDPSDAGATSSPAVSVEHHHEPHEVGWLMNGPLVVLAIGALLAGVLGEPWIVRQIAQSTAQVTSATEFTAEVPRLLDMPVHHALMLLSGFAAVLGIVLAGYYHWFDRRAAERIALKYEGLVRLLRNKYYGDEIYDAAIVKPLHLLGEVFYVFDTFIIDGLVAGIGWLPRLLGKALAPTQRGKLQGYALGMAVGAVVLVVLVVIVTW